MTDTDIWNWISAFIQSFAETFLLVNVYCAFLGQPRIKKYVAYSLISCFAIAYCVFIAVTMVLMQINIASYCVTGLLIAAISVVAGKFIQNRRYSQCSQKEK